MILENATNLAAKIGDVRAADTFKILTVDDDLTAAVAFDKGDEAQQRAFPRAGVASDEYQLARFDIEIYMSQCFVATGINLVDVVELNHLPEQTARAFTLDGVAE